MKIVKHFFVALFNQMGTTSNYQDGCDILKYNQSFQIYNKLNFIQSSRNNEK